ncbi:DUF1501 domain-containing protein [Limnoglobus roseus]|uniref:DUF1501 domain-containing protein n=1 Tax=Limnoglobus roseus TaxID=2598579 RepID=A0A5C1ADZ0_9BACT|nr:DUF1501 domain-containing protein [Limnoglobus roseus]QEL15288.1 hypothetical protein PX52LOC_02203 [Limnoglobus roseus]
MPIAPAPTRRQFVQVGASTALGLGLPSLLASRAHAATRKSKSVILVNLTGGLSHIDTLDMKPDAPAEMRGEFKPISTAIPGVQICEHLPLLAKRMQTWALVRSLSHNENGHLPGTHRLLTGSTMPLKRGSDLDNVLSRRDWPCYAAGLNYVRPRHDGVPNGVTLPHSLIEGPLTWPGQHAGFLGPHHDPMLVKQDPNSPKFRMDAFSLPDGVDPARVDSRRSLLDNLESSGQGDPAFRGHQHQAFELLSSGKVATAFHLDREAPTVRDRYGRNQFGQSLLLARRLVQSGVPIVQANMGIVQTWDTHTDNWGKLKNRLLPWLDQGLAALIEDLQQEGLFADTLVAVLGEFGRTPKISTLPGQTVAGRDHWASVYSGLFAGGGVVGGRVIGKSDKVGAHPVSQPYTPYDIGATIYQALGVPPDAEIRDTLNRPTAINAGRPMDILFENR